MGKTNPNLETELKQIIAEILEKDQNEIIPNAKFIEDLGMDSMMALEILVATEKKYQIKIPEEKLRSINSLQETTALVKEILAA